MISHPFSLYPIIFDIKIVSMSDCPLISHIARSSPSNNVVIANHLCLFAFSLSVLVTPLDHPCFAMTSCFSLRIVAGAVQYPPSFLCSLPVFTHQQKRELVSPWSLSFPCSLIGQRRRESMGNGKSSFPLSRQFILRLEPSPSFTPIHLRFSSRGLH